MSTKSRHQKSTSTEIAPRLSGRAAPLMLHSIAGPGGTTVVQINVDLTKAPAPDRRYLADTAWADTRDGFLRLIFAQRKVGDDASLRSLVEINVPPEGVRRFIESCTSQFMEGFRGFIVKNGIGEDRLSPITAEPPQAVSLAANLLAAAYSGREAEMYFFHIAPMAIHQVRNGAVPSLDPIVRVDMRTSLLAAVIAFVLRMKDSLPPEVT